MAADESHDDRTHSFVALTKGIEVSHYKIIEKIGAGGMGVVFLASDAKLGRRVALKFLPPALIGNRPNLMRFRREARLAASLNHPNIVTIHEFGEHDRTPFIVMEFVEGHSLRDMLKRGSLSIEESLNYISQVCRGLAEAHNRGVIHRDIKPSNIIIDSKGLVRILDFGLAKLDADGEATVSGGIMGTINYMSPEQCMDERVDHRADLFAVGVVLSECLSTKNPFVRSNTAATINAIIHESPPALPAAAQKAKPGLQEILNRLLAKKPSDRFSSASELLGALERLQQEDSKQLAKQSLDVSKMKSLAILYLKNLGSEDAEFLSYGITEDLIVDLSRLGSMRIVPLRRVLAFKGKDMDLDEIAHLLNVELILDGSIHRSENSVRISAQLVHVATDRILWSNRWEELPDNIPSIKQDLAVGVSGALSIDAAVVSEAQVGKPEASDAQAYEHYLRGKFAFEHKKSEADVEVARGLYRRALELEPKLLAAKAGLSEIYVHIGQYDLANVELTAALQTARRSNLRADEMRILRLLAKLRERQSRWDEAIDESQKATQIARQLGDLVGEVQALAALIGTFRMRSRFDEAHRAFQRVQEIHLVLDQQQKSPGAIGNMGCVHFAEGEYDKALALFTEALAISKEQQDVSGEASCISNIGATYYILGDLEAALDHYQNAIQLHTNIGDRGGKLASFYINIGLIHQSTGDYQQAIDNFTQASALRKQLGEMDGYAMASVSLAGPLILTGQLDEAQGVAEDALKTAKELDYPLVISEASASLGLIEYHRGNHHSAVNHYHQALAVAEEADLRSNMAGIQSMLGEVLFDSGDYEHCRSHLKLSLDAATELGEAALIVPPSILLAALEVRVGDATHGTKELRNCLRQAEDHGDPRWVILAMRLLGESLMKPVSEQIVRSEGHQVLQDALTLATAIGLVREIRLIQQLMRDDLPLS